jgi:solute carrier family 39 (zinc transporter), member 1/2/3
VLLATAFVHLLPTAFTSLNDPCLPYVFSQGYRPMPGLIAMVSALVVVSIESYLTTRGAGHSHNHNHAWDPEDEFTQHRGHVRVGSAGGGLAAKRASDPRPADIALEDLGDRARLMDNASPLPESSPANISPPSGTNPLITKSNHDDDDDDLELDLDELDPTAEGSDSQPLARRNIQAASEPVSPRVTSPEEQKRLLIQCLLLEAGILFHSIFIGMAVSVATGPPFVVFLIAIGFHQTFEGLALGSRIAAIQFPKHSVRPWLMVLAYGTTTPFGQVIGLIVHNLYDPMSQTGLLMVGFMNAISSGLLLFAGLVQLLAEDFLTEKSYKSLKGRDRTHAFLSVLGGAGLMALVGAFA